jgi:hypothetical protein
MGGRDLLHREETVVQVVGRHIPAVADLELLVKETTGVLGINQAETTVAAEAVEQEVQGLPALAAVMVVLLQVPILLGHLQLHLVLVEHMLVVAGPEDIV